MLFVSIVLILLIQTISFSPYSIAVETSDPVIVADDMAVTEGIFVDTSPDSRENKLWSYVGGKDLISFINLGVSNTKTTDEVLVYEAEVIFGFEMTLYTSAAFDNIYPNIKVDNIRYLPFFSVETSMLYPARRWTNTYSVGFNDVELGTKVSHDYTGSIPITVNFKTWTGKQPLTVNGVEISTPYYTADISNVKTVNIRSGVVGGYKDVFTDSTGIKEGTVDFTRSEDEPDEIGDILDWLETKDLGWTGSNITSNFGIQRSVITAPPIEKDNPYPATIKDFTFNVPAQLRPEVYSIKNDIELRKASIWFHQELLGDWFLTVTQDPTKETVERTVGVNVVNQFVHWDFTVKMIVYATVENSAELSESILNDPYLEMGDFIWDTGFVGVREVDVRPPSDPADDWWIWLIVILIVGIGLYIGYKILKKRSERSFMLQLAGRGKYRGV